LAGAVVVSRMMQGMLYGVGALDPIAFIVAVSALLLVAVAAGIIPARRVATVDPITTLRGD
jgi:putative ABC transport system permease protein